jgi:hypothetical protein
LHPRSGTEMEWTAAIPDDLSKVLKLAGISAPALD